MTICSLYIPLQAKPGKEEEVADLLRPPCPCCVRNLTLLRGLRFRSGYRASPLSERSTTRPDLMLILTTRSQQP